jgi:hypothetical protein
MNWTSQSIAEDVQLKGSNLEETDALANGLGSIRGDSEELLIEMTDDLRESASELGDGCEYTLSIPDCGVDLPELPFAAWLAFFEPPERFRLVGLLGFSRSRDT